MKVPLRIARQMSALVVALGFVLSASGGWAADKPMPYPEFRTSNSFSRFVQNVSGFTPLSGWMANRILRRELGKYVHGKLKSKLTLYSGGDLLAGKARRIELSGKNVLLDDFIPLSEFSFASVEDSPIYVSKSSRPILLKPIEFKVEARMSEADINRMLSSEKGRKMLTGIKVSIPPFGRQYLDVLNPAVTLEGERITIVSLINKKDQPPEYGLPIKVSGKLSTERSRLNLSDLDLQIEGFEDANEIERLIEAYFSEIVDLNHIKVDRHKVRVSIDESEIIDKQLHLRATVKVEPKRSALEKYMSK